MVNKIRVAVAGAGVGRQHVAAFHQLPELYEVVAVCDLNVDRAAALAQEENVPRVTARLEDLYAMDGLDLIDLCTPSGLHYEQTLRALQAGKDVILEKPVAGSIAEVDGLIAAEQQTGQRIMPIFQSRFGNGVRKLKHLQALGLTGQAYVATVETSWRRRPEYYATWHGKWRSELGGPLVTLAVHAHDILYFVLGPARSVFARAKTMVNPIETEDCVSASLEMADGSLASITVTTGSARELTRHRYCFSRMVAESGLAPYQSTADPWTFEGDTPEIDAEIALAMQTFQPVREGFLGQFEQFHAARMSGGPMPVSLQDARNSLELITALYDSAWSGKAIALPLGPEHPYYYGWVEAAQRISRG